MIAIPSSILSRYENVLKRNEFSSACIANSKKWLRYYHDYCEKYPVPDDNSERVRLFCEKLREKKQPEQQRQQAAHAVSLFFEMEGQSEFTGCQISQSSGVGTVVVKEEFPQYQAIRRDLPVGDHKETIVNPQLPRVSRGSSHYCEAGYQEKSASPEWDEVVAKLAAEIKIRHYSRNTLKTYALWSRQFQRFLKNKHPEELSSVDVKDYLTFLAVKCKVAASTQNQAFNALLFLYRHALKKDFGRHTDIPRAKKSLYIPMVLSRPEIDAILEQLSYPYKLFVQILRIPHQVGHLFRLKSATDSD